MQHVFQRPAITGGELKRFDPVKVGRRAIDEAPRERLGAARRGFVAFADAFELKRGATDG